MSSRSVFNEFVDPGNKMFEIRSVGVPSVVLSPRELTVKQANVDARHLLSLIVIGYTQVFCP